MTGLTALIDSRRWVRHNARRLRKAFSPRRQPPGTSDRFALTNDDLYLMKTTPLPDLTAQLCLFVLQTDLSAEPGVMQWLTLYVTRNFRIANHEARQEIAQDIVLRLLRHKWWMETPQAWRRYVATHRHAVERAYSCCSALPDGEVPDSRATTEDQLIAAIDGNPETAGDTGSVNPPIRFRPTSALSHEACSVREASQLLGLSVGAVYCQDPHATVARARWRRAVLDSPIRVGLLLGDTQIAGRSRGGRGRARLPLRLLVVVSVAFVSADLLWIKFFTPSELEQLSFQPPTI